MGVTVADADPASPGALPRLLPWPDTGRSELLALAVRHASHVHEHGVQVGEARALRTLAHVGTAFVSRSVALRVYAHADETPAGGIPKQVPRLEEAFEAWADRHGGTGRWSVLGRRTIQGLTAPGVVGSCRGDKGSHEADDASVTLAMLAAFRLVQ